MAVTDADILGWLNANPDADPALIDKTMKEAGVNADQFKSATGYAPPPVTQATTTSAPPAKSAPDPIEKLTQQILGQKLTSKWSGEGLGSAQANARDMAKILADTGITDIKQFGKITTYQPLEVIGKSYDGQPVKTYTDEDTGKTTSYILKFTGQTDENGQEVYSQVAVPSTAKLDNLYGVTDSEGVYAVDPSKVVIKDGQAVMAAGETFGNKATGKTVANTYSERQTGNAFGGTFQGKGNTGYRVQFAPDGTPIFYTTQASSNDLANLMQDLGPIGNIALTAIGGPMAVAAVAALSGKPPGDILKSAALSYLGGQAGNFVSGMEGITDVLGDVGTNVASNAAKQYVGSGGKGINPLGLVLGSGVTNGLFADGSTGPNSADFTEGYFNEGGEGYNILNSDTTDDFLKSIGINSVDELTDSGMSNADILNLVTGNYGDLTGLEDFVNAGDEEGVDMGEDTGEEGADEGADEENTGKSASSGSGGGSNTVRTQGTTTPGGTKTTGATTTGTTTNGNTSTVGTKNTGGTKSTDGVNVASKIASLVDGEKTATLAKTPTNPAVDAVTGLAQQQAQQQNQQNALLNFISGKDELAHIKSYKDLHGNNLFGESYVPPSAGGPEETAQGAEEFFNGGHVDDLSIDALLHILRN